MSDYHKYDPRVDALVMEMKTLWDSEVGDLSDEDKQWLSEEVHRDPASAVKIDYDRSHTGFTRTITVTVEDIGRLYDRKMAAT